MRILPILFSTPMVKAIDTDKKKVTRRIMKQQPVLNGNFWELGGAGWSDTIKSVTPVPCHSLYEKIPFKPETILWVRETFFDITYGHPNYEDSFLYKANATEGEIKSLKWRPSIFMPKEAARFFLKVIEVRVERLQVITEEEAIKEGIYKHISHNIVYWKNGADGLMYDTPKDAFQALWQSINGPESWNLNPWVWVYNFEKINKPENF